MPRRDEPGVRKAGFERDAWAAIEHGDGATVHRKVVRRRDAGDACTQHDALHARPLLSFTKYKSAAAFPGDLYAHTLYRSGGLRHLSWRRHLCAGTARHLRTRLAPDRT